MELFELKANIREATGKGVARELRRNNSIPAVLYGLANEPVKVQVAMSDIEAAFKQSKIAQVLVNLSVLDNDKEVKKCPAIIKDLQLSPLSKDLLHADFLEISLEKPVLVKVPVEAVGKAPGVEFGGTLQLIRRELEILCMPLEIPESIAIDVNSLQMGDAIHVKDIEIEGVEIPADVNFTVITVVAPKAVTEDVEDEELDGEEAAEEGTEEAAE